MPHIHEKIDFTVALFIVREDQVLLVHHWKLNKWLPVGGHIELDEDPETAALREAKEESGLDITLVGERPPTACDGTRALIAPRYLDIHRINKNHEHIGMIYWATADSGDLTLSAREHHAIGWFRQSDLDSLNPPLSPAIQWYCRQALKELQAPPREQGV